MRILTTIVTTIFALTVLAVTTTPAGASLTRELIGTVGGSFEGQTGVAVDLETGNVYVLDGPTGTINIFSATGGPPVGGGPSQITGQQFYNPNESNKSALTAIAIDNSCYEHIPKLTGGECEIFDPSYGDIYIPHVTANGGSLRKYKLGHDYQYELVEEIEIKTSASLNSANGLGVDANGTVYVAAENSVILEHLKQQKSGENIEVPQNFIRDPVTVAVGEPGELFVAVGRETNIGMGVGRLRLGALGEVLSEEVFAPPLGQSLTPPEAVGNYRPVVVDRSTGNVFIGDGDRVAEYAKSGGGPLLEFGSSEPSGGSIAGYQAITSVAVNSGTGLVYVTNQSHGDVDVFGPLVEPPVIPNQQPGVSDVTQTSALLAGTANPESGTGTYWYEYVAAAEYEPGASDPYVAGGRTASTELPSAHALETFERVLLSGLVTGTTYHYRLVVKNPNTTSYGPDQTFTTAPPIPPVAVTGPAGEVTATGATLSGSVDPKGLATSYVFELGTGTNYAGARLFGNAGESTGEVSVGVSLQYLVPGTTYHYRLVASNFDGTSYGQDESFTTPAIASQIAQPTSVALIGVPSIAFPSILGATTEPVKITTKSFTNKQKLQNALRVCRKKVRGQRAACEKRANKKYGKKP